MADAVREQNKKPKEAPNKRFNRIQESEKAQGHESSQEQVGKKPVPEFKCPLGCGHLVKWGSLANFANFIQTPKRQKVDKVKKSFCCIKCLKALNRVRHKSVRDCAAPNCKKCDGLHHTIVCPNETGEQKLYKTSEDDPEDEEDQDGYGEDDDLFNEDLNFRFNDYGEEQETHEDGEDFEDTKGGEEEDKVNIDVDDVKIEKEECFRWRAD